jgi:RNA polymerase sigma factor (TIGR02999 family)
VSDQLDQAIEGSPAEGLPVGALWSTAYQDLKQLAHARLRRSGRNTLLDTTALVNEAFTRLAGTARLQLEHRGQFFAYSARVMRSVIIDLVREAQAARRGGDPLRITLNTAICEAAAAKDDPLQIDEALQLLAGVEPRLAQVVEMRYFAGLTEVEVGEALGLTERTVRRDWQRARALLRTMLMD